MNTAQLDELMAFNDQLLALDEAGVPIDVGQEVRLGDLSTTLERINFAIARRVSGGDSLEEALQTDPTVPVWYRNLIVPGLRTDNMDRALREFSQVADSVEESRFVIDSAMFYPLVVVSLAYIGIVGFCLFFVPILRAAYTGLEIRPGTGLVILQKLRDTLPIWIAIPPVLLVLFIVWRYRRRSRRAFSAGRRGLFAAVAGTSRAMFQQQCAHFAESLASLEEGNVPFKKSLEMAAQACGEPSLAEAARLLAAMVSNSGSAASESAAATRFPPFLRWALLQSEPTVGRKNALRMAAALYRESSIHSMQRARIIAPIIALVLLGGSVTLMYGLALFVPVVQMLKEVATPH